MKNLIESAKTNQATSAAKAYAAAQFAYPFYPAYSQAAVRAASLFWSVFGPAARYGFRNSGYAYAALMKP